jgi:hypothetical protein
MFYMIIRVLGRLKAEEANEMDPRLAPIDAQRISLARWTNFIS